MILINFLFYSFLIIFLIQVAYYAVLFLRFGLSKINKPSKKNIGISVLICAKNESENLKAFIPFILEQDYPQFEIILINDDSKDDTLDIMEGFAASSERVKVVNVKPVDAFWKNKKYPLTLGIKASTYNFLLFTDADCKPLSNRWISEMSRHFSNTNEIVLGYGGYKKIPGSFLNTLIRFETVFTAMQYFSFAIIGKPYMGVGRNLAYRKETFFKVKGFTEHMNVASGDDDLFINQAANSYNTTICIDPASFTESIPKQNFRAWFDQKRRHITTSKYYKSNFKILLGLFYMSQFLFWALAFTLLILSFQWKLVLAIFLLRLLLVYISYGLSAKKFKALDTLLFLPILELFLIIVQMVIFISNQTSKTHHWR